MAEAGDNGEGRQLIPIVFTLNGTEERIDVEPHELLINVLRNRLGLTGTKKSCDVQVCGACTVLIDGRPVSSCTLLAFEVRGRKVLTIEGLAKGGKLHPLQDAFIDHGGLQCGFCTPGMILAAKALLDQNPQPTQEDVVDFMDGNICRCTGYKSIVTSILAAAEILRNPAGSHRK
jgi:aerobic-type carbon monoxide dehydrogenase small subunit (CoxS/CutS family)